MTTRRQFLAASGAALAAPAVAQAPQAASLRLNWLLYGFHAPFLYGVERGLYREAGVDLTVGEGQGSARAVQIVAAGSDTFGLSDGTSIIAGAARGAPLRAVMGIMNRSPFAVIVREDSGIRVMADLRGKTIAATTGEAGLTIFPALLRANKMGADDVRFLRVDGAGKMVATLEGRTVGLLGGFENQALVLPQRGTPVRSLLYADNGVNTVGLAIHTTRETQARNPDLVRRFVAATRRAFEQAEREPEAAIDALLKVKPDFDRALSLAQLKAGMTLMRSARAMDKPIGAMAPEDWSETLALMKEFQELRTDLPAEAFYTNEFAPA
ncbi:ABC transporter substrate-binding protein [Roseomonas sp. OT10]|uniref:ABC transporter substrate-binding protein n=1 Tax=Roseomonas cutis TaxID=2897332 RepID=UPI001E4FCBC5|nr:ABC transporter substrate-binding protein [Roseomonas sp. OT10]UFN49445.1 ABC transporter substrate-binding protein [Roseomonas sp. OT10]